MRLVRGIVIGIATPVALAILFHKRVDLTLVVIGGLVLAVVLVYALVPRVEESSSQVYAPPDRGPGEPPGAPDRALFAELIKARSRRRAERQQSRRPPTA